MNSFTDLKHVLYINLEHRQDRRTHIEQQLKNVGLASFERFNAIRLPNGRVGCSLSHIKCLELAKERGWPHVLICEDDTVFSNPSVLQQSFNHFVASQKPWDVLLFAGNNMPPFDKISPYFIRVTRCQTTTCYMVQAHYYDRLLANIRQGVTLLMKEPHNHLQYAIDKFWFYLQQKDRWFLLTPLTVLQRADYSDIERKVTNYGALMLDLDKAAVIERMAKQSLGAMPVLKGNGD